MSLAWNKPFVLFLLLPITSGLDFLVSPTNQAIVAGEQLFLHCQPDGFQFASLNWKQGEEVITSKDEVEVAFQDRVDLFSDKLTLAYNIRMNNTVIADATKYQCQAWDNVYYRRFSYLIVLVNEPECKPNVSLTNLIEGEDFIVSCTAEYTEPIKQWQPELFCEDSNTAKITTDDGDSVLGKFRSFFKISAKRSHHDIYYRCYIKFPEPPEGIIPNETELVKYSKAAPSYEFEYRTDILNVQFPLENLKISDPKLEYIPGDEITCSADGRPIVKVQWVKVDTVLERTLKTSILSIDKSMEGWNEYRCEGSNSINGVSYKSEEPIRFRVTIPTTTTPTSTTQGVTTDVPEEITTKRPNQSGGLSDGAIAGIVIGSILLVGLIVAIIFFILFRVMPSKDASKTKMKQPLSVSNKPGQGMYGHTNGFTNTGLQPVIPNQPNQQPDDLALYLADNRAGSRSPLPAKELVEFSDLQKDWI